MLWDLVTQFMGSLPNEFEFLYIFGVLFVLYIFLGIFKLFIDVIKSFIGGF